MKWILLISGLCFAATTFAASEQFVRYEYQGQMGYGQLKEQNIYPVEGDLFGQFTLSTQAIKQSDVKLLLPVEPEKVFAVGMNFASHLSSPSNKPPPLFLKLPSSLVLSGEPVMVPKGASNVHFEGELVLVIGKQIRYVTESEASDAIFGVTVGNDITERGWQGRDLQWLRSKAADGFGPIGATITRGVDYNNVILTTRLNGKVVQQESTKNMIHSPTKVVSYLSQYFTLKPGDLIYMGTPGRTKALKNNDVVSVSIEGVGELSNKIQF
ncbi:fumarylacetoacetate hydrolase family protein [Vibrio breoganii]